MKKNKVGNFVGLASRKQRRKDAKLNGEKFQPHYNDTEPFRVQHKDALKNQINADKYAEKCKRKTS